MLFYSVTCFSQNTFPSVGNVGIGTLTPQFPLDVNGSARISGNLLVGGGIITASVINTTSQLNAGDANITNNLNIAGSSSVSGLFTAAGAVHFPALGAGNIFRPLYVTPTGNVVSSLVSAPGWIDPSFGNSCNPFSSPWLIGGNAISGTGFNDITVGTCDNYDFILKSNAVPRQWIKTDGTIGFGTGIASNTGGPEYKFHQGALRLTNNNSFGGPQIVFDGDQTDSHIFGDWGIEYLSTINSPAVQGLNFWKPAGSPNSFNYLFFIGDDGRVSVGNVTNPSSARFNVDGWSGDGIKALVNTTTKAYTVYDKLTNLEKFVVYGNGATHIGAANVQIGFSNIAIQETATALNINNLGNDGVKFHTSSSTIRAISVMNTNTATSVFTVKGNGQTIIGGEYPFNPNSSPYMLAVNGKIGAREIKVSIQNTWPDYVFAKEYKLSSLENLESYLRENKHLPNIPSAKELDAEELGLDLAEMQGKQMEKIEEIYLHLIDLNKQIKELKKENEVLKKQLKK